MSDSQAAYSLLHPVKPGNHCLFHAVENRAIVPDVCGWPNLQRLPDGTLLVFIFNQPCHGRWEGDVDCWASDDDGDTWTFRGRPAPHEPGTNRMGRAVGQTVDGGIIVISGGYGDRPPRPSDNGRGEEPRKRLKPWICRSEDAGRNWTHTEDGWPMNGDDGILWPFGKIMPGTDGSLRVVAYDAGGTCYVLRSRDNGCTWGEPVPIQRDGNETALLPLGDKRWLAAIRQRKPRQGAVTGRQWDEDHLELFRSDDDGGTWQHVMPLTLPRQHPADLLQLADGRILLTYGNRCLNNQGIDARFSEDDGGSWTPPIRIAPCDLSNTDGGYPSSVQLADGRIVTVYYDSRNTVKGRDRDPDFTAAQAKLTPDDQLQLHYELRMSRWNPADF